MVEIIVSQKPKIALLSWRWPLWLSLTLFFSSLVAFIFLKVYLSQLESDIVSINNRIKIESAKVNANDEKSIINLNDSLLIFSSVITNHSYFSNFFEIIGSLTYARVTFTTIDANKEEGIVQLNGDAQNYTALAKQIVALRDSKHIKNLEVKGINFGDKGLEFELLLGVDPKMFLKQPL